MNALMKQIHRIGIVPVIKITDPKTAVPLARALEAGGIPIAEVTFRTEHAAEAIRRIVAEVPGVLTGAGTVLTIGQVDAAVEAGAKFIVTPGFNPKVVDYCLSKGIAIVPGAPGTSDIEQAIEKGLEVVKCFPAEALGGLPYIKAVAAPYGGIQFMPTGGIGPKNINNYLSFNKIVSCGGSWMIDQKLIDAGDYEGITVLGLEFAHVGINSENAAQAEQTASLLAGLFPAARKETPTVVFMGDGIEIMKKTGKGKNGHLAIACNNLDRAVFQLERRGLAFDHEAAGTDSMGHRYIFLKDEIAGYAVHLSER